MRPNGKIGRSKIIASIGFAHDSNCLQSGQGGPVKPADGAKKADAATSGPMDIKTKAGKMIVSAVEDIQKETPITLIKKETDAPANIVDLSTKSGTLNITATTTKDNKLDVSARTMRSTRFLRAIPNPAITAN